MSVQIDFSRCINGEYKIYEILGSGAFSQVHRVQDQDGTSRAAKFVPLKYEKILKTESEILQDIGHQDSQHNTPSWYYYGRHGDAYVLVMELLGKSILSLHKRRDNGLGLKAVLKIGIQLVHRLEFLHNKGIIHRDLKPDNVVVGRSESDDTEFEKVYIIDYGLSLRYKDSRNRHKSKTRTFLFYGSQRFSSRHAHRYERQSRRSDLESLVYSMIYLLKGSLPWNAASLTEAGKMKECISTKRLCEGLPKEISTFFDDVKRLKYDDCPNYSALVGYLESSLNRTPIDKRSTSSKASSSKANSVIGSRNAICSSHNHEAIGVSPRTPNSSYNIPTATNSSCNSRRTTIYSE